MGALGARDDRFVRALERLLLDDATRDFELGWQMALDLGRPAAPLLWECLRAEKSNVRRRLVLLTAAVLAGGPAEDGQLFAWLDNQSTMLEERVMAGFLLAMGPRRQRPLPDFWNRLLGPTRSPQTVLGIAARLAAARFPGSETSGPGLGDEDDPGLASATLFAGLPLRASLQQKWWNLKNPERHAELVWRGALIAGITGRGDSTGFQGGSLLDRAREVGQLPGEVTLAARDAAALFRSYQRDVRLEGARPDWRTLQSLVADPAAAVLLQPWLTPVPQPLDDEPIRLAVAYVFSREPAQVITDRATWGADPRIRRHVAVALAFRLLGDAATKMPAVPLAGVPEWFFVNWANGNAVAVDGQLDDPILGAAAKLATEGRLSRPAARTVLEEWLWRTGGHPGIGLYQAERLLIRDLLLLGSRQAGKFVPNARADQIYRAGGSIDKDHQLFDIAVPLWEFLNRPRPPLPAELRLR